MENLKPLSACPCTDFECLSGSIEPPARNRATRSLGQHVGTPHSPEIGYQTVQIPISHFDTVDIDDGFNEPHGCQKRCQRWPVNARMEARRGTFFRPVGGKHRGAQQRQAVAADDGSNKEAARTQRLAQRDGCSLHVVDRFEFAD